VSVMRCNYCDNYIDTDFVDDCQWEPDFKCGACVEQEKEDATEFIMSWGAPYMRSTGRKRLSPLALLKRKWRLI
jgi:hypothetical protein